MTTIALKEWAVAVKALREGHQTLLIRKGGIREETRDFRILSPNFLLFPTFEHQRADLLQPEYARLLDEVLAVPRDLGRIRIDTWAEVTDQFEVTETWQLEALAPYYCWTVGYAEERLRWRPTKPLLVISVRAFRLASPLELEARPEFSGCKSWLTLDADVSLVGCQPALSDEEYAGRVEAVRSSLRRQPATT